MRIITGFHAVEERIRSIEAIKGEKDLSGIRILFANPGPRVKKILSEARKIGLNCSETTDKELDKMVSSLPETARDHRGIIYVSEKEAATAENIIEFDQFLTESIKKEDGLVVILDSVTDPHNLGAVIRSCDQFGVSLLVLPDRRSAKDGEVVARSSAGASAWVPVSIVTNLPRVVDQLKKAGYWVYGADAGGDNLSSCKFSKKIALVMGSEGSGISRLVKEKCDTMISIPTCGKLDSLNVSVAAGVLLYEIHKQSL